MQECQRQGHGAFVVWKDKAYFKSQSVVACRRALKNDQDATTYLNLAPLQTGDFEEHAEMNTFPGKNAHKMPAADVEACKRECRRRGDGAFVVRRGMAYFKSQSVLDCREGLEDDDGARTYLFTGPKVARLGIEALSGVLTVLGGQRELSKEDFVRICNELLDSRGVQPSAKERRELYEVFDSMDFDCNGSLSVGEWAGGLSVFLKGDLETSVRAVFNALDTNHNYRLSKDELGEYFAPFVKAMTPPRADALRPVLVKKVVDVLFQEIDADGGRDVSSEELLAWMQRGNNVVKKVAGIIDQQVYQGCIGAGMPYVFDAQDYQATGPLPDEQEQEGVAATAKGWSDWLVQTFTGGDAQGDVAGAMGAGAPGQEVWRNAPQAHKQTGVGFNSALMTQQGGLGAASAHAATGGGMGGMMGYGVGPPGGPGQPPPWTAHAASRAAGSAPGGPHAGWGWPQERAAGGHRGGSTPGGWAAAPGARGGALSSAGGAAPRQHRSHAAVPPPPPQR